MPLYKRDYVNPDRPLKTAQVARIIGISQRHLVRKLLDGTLPEPQRDPHSNYRVWKQRDVEALRIMMAKESA
jgi:hypothetical protein